MSIIRPIAQLDTHEVLNQPPPFEDIDLFSSDRALTEAVKRAGGDVHSARLTALGRRAGSAEVMEWGVQANRNPPVLDTFDRYGRRIDEVSFHPAYHQLMTLGLENGAAAVSWEEGPAGHVAHAGIHVPDRPGGCGHDLSDDNDLCGGSCAPLGTRHRA